MIGCHSCVEIAAGDLEMEKKMIEFYWLPSQKEKNHRFYYLQDGSSDLKLRKQIGEKESQG